MNENPYESPKAQSAAEAQEPRVGSEVAPGYLVKVAAAQRWVLFSLAAQIFFFLVGFALPLVIPPGLSSEALDLITYVSMSVSLIILAVALYSIFRLVRVLQGSGVAVIATLLSLMPSIRLFVLFYYNYHATKELRNAGVAVGFMGVDPRSI